MYILWPNQFIITGMFMLYIMSIFITIVNDYIESFNFHFCKLCTVFCDKKLCNLVIYFSVMFFSNLRKGQLAKELWIKDLERYISKTQLWFIIIIIIIKYIINLKSKLNVMLMFQMCLRETFILLTYIALLVSSINQPIFFSFADDIWLVGWYQSQTVMCYICTKN